MFSLGMAHTTFIVHQKMKKILDMLEVGSHFLRLYLLTELFHTDLLYKSPTDIREWHLACGLVPPEPFVVTQRLMLMDLILHSLQDLWLVSSCKHFSSAKPENFQLLDSKHQNLDEKAHRSFQQKASDVPLPHNRTVSLTNRAPSLIVVSTFSNCVILAFIQFNTVFA